jgi:arylsulfatase
MAAPAGALLKTLVAEPPIKPGAPDPYTPPKPGDLRPGEQVQIDPIIQYVTSLVREHDGVVEPDHGLQHAAG